MSVKDKNILLTGGSMGLGKATAIALIEAGANVAITGRNETRLQAVATEIGAFPIIADVSNETDVENTYQSFLKQFGHLDVLINNAGLARGSAEIDEVKLKDFEFVFGINVFGAAMMAKHAAKHFKERKKGDIVNIASTASLKGYPNGSIYAASKFALRGMSQCWQAELRKYNVRVIQINPTYVPTAFGTADRVEKPLVDNLVQPADIAHSIVGALQMEGRAFIPELTVWATNPWE